VTISTSGLIPIERTRHDGIDHREQNIRVPHKQVVDMAVRFGMLPITLWLSNLSLTASNRCDAERDQLLKVSQKAKVASHATGDLF
jgi:hypothetical protein